MKLSRTFRLALKSILASKARSLLTMLGIIIGVAAVIVIVGLGNGMERYMTESFQSLGTNLLTVSVSGRGSARSVSVDEMYDIAAQNKDLFTGVSPSVSVMATVKSGTETMDTANVTGVGEDYADMRGYSLSAGRFIGYADILNRNKVCIVGSYINWEWFGGNAVGSVLKINGESYEIMGVMSEIADSTENSNDNQIYLPYSNAAKINGTANISTYYFAMVSEDLVQNAKDAITAALYGVFESTDAFNIMSLSEMLSTMTSMINIVVMVLAIIAGISLLVGGIGIMNIMLVSVSERTREIGIRKALGAKRRHVLTQFLIEGGVTSAIGGIIGIIIGYLLSSGGTFILTLALETELVITPSTWSVLMAFGVSAGIGILFGYLPARKAARLHPIDALRYE